MSDAPAPARRPAPRYFWTKVWGAPHPPDREALTFSSVKVRDDVLATTRPGDIVVYLTTKGLGVDGVARGHVVGAVEITDRPVTAEEMGIMDRARPEHDFRADGRFKWPHAIAISRAWHVMGNEITDHLVPDHAGHGHQGATHIHELPPEAVQRFLELMVREVGVEAARTVEGGAVDASTAEPFQDSLRRPWRQKAGPRAGTEVEPGCDLYVAWIYEEANGITWKVGSGKHAERIEALNEYRRPSQGEAVWKLAKGLRRIFDTVDAARAAEDHLLRQAKAMGHGSPDHSEFLMGLDDAVMRRLFAEAVKAGETAEECSL